MEFKTILVKIDNDGDVTKFDKEINSLVTDGFRLEKRIVVPTEEEVHLPHVGQASRRRLAGDGSHPSGRSSQ